MTLIERLRALARSEHDDLSIGDEAADAREGAADALEDAGAERAVKERLDVGVD